LILHRLSQKEHTTQNSLVIVWVFKVVEKALIFSFIDLMIV
jgi:hypothetical protein